MSSTLSILNNFEMPYQGTLLTGKQGASTDAPTDPFQITVNGQAYVVANTLATATANKLYDSSVNFPATWSYLYFWADQIVYLQTIGATSNCIHRLAAKQPFVLPGYQTMLGAANTTPITGGGAPSVESVATIYLANYSGQTADYLLALIS